MHFVAWLLVYALASLPVLLIASAWSPRSAVDGPCPSPRPFSPDLFGGTGRNVLGSKGGSVREKGDTPTRPIPGIRAAGLSSSRAALRPGTQHLRTRCCPPPGHPAAAPPDLLGPPAAPLRPPPEGHRPRPAVRGDVRTAYRDLDFLRDEWRVPGEFDRPQGNRLTEPTTALPPVTLSQGELVALYFAEKVLAQYRGTPFEADLTSAFRKLQELRRARGNATPPGPRGRIAGARMSLGWTVPCPSVDQQA